MQLPEMPMNSDDFDPIDIPNDGLSPLGRTEGVMNGDQAQQLCAEDMNVAFGILGDGETGERVDVVMLEFRTLSNDIHRVLLHPEMMSQLMNAGAEWFDTMHNEGRCECEDHDELLPDLDKVNTIKRAIQRVLDAKEEEGDDDGTLW